MRHVDLARLERREVAPPSRIFVLSAGRCGARTFIRACSHLSNFTASHDRRTGWSPSQLLDHPEHHITADRRLAWHLGPLAERYPDAWFVHLRRDLDAVVDSYVRNWPVDLGVGDLRRHPMQVLRERFGASRPAPWPEPVVRDHVKAVDATIAQFLLDKPHVDVSIGWPADFDRFLSWIGAEGDLESARLAFTARPARLRRHVGADPVAWSSTEPGPSHPIPEVQTADLDARKAPQRA